MNCRICSDPLRELISFGKMPIANGFLTPDEFDQEYFFDLAVGYCQACLMVQLIETVPPHRLFHEEYAYFSSISVRMKQHFARFAEDVAERHLLGSDPFVVEIGCNDGILLEHFHERAIRHLGVDPSRNVVEAAQRKGVRAECRFFGAEVANEILQGEGPADVVLAANVFCHLPDIHSIVSGVRDLLKPRGLLIFEDPYLLDILRLTSYDQIYDEHVYYFSVHSLSELFRRHEMEIVDVSPQSVHGGSMRYAVAFRGAYAVQPVVERQLEIEREAGLQRFETYRAFRNRVHRSREQLLELLESTSRAGKRVVGYGATSKSTTVINFCGITSELVEFLSDTTPGKQGKYSPGRHIPVLPYDRFREDFPDYALLFAWNHAEEILEKEEAFLAQGGRFIEYVPEVGIRRRTGAG